MSAVIPEYCPMCCRIALPDIREMELSEANGRGVAVYPGQSADEVLLLASITEHGAEVGHYPARQIAREVLVALARAR